MVSIHERKPQSRRLGSNFDKTFHDVVFGIIFQAENAENETIQTQNNFLTSAHSHATLGKVIQSHTRVNEIIIGVKETKKLDSIVRTVGILY